MEITNYPIRFVFIALFAIFLSGCESNEEKAKKLILSNIADKIEKIDDFEPIQTKVSIAYNTAFGNPTMFQMATDFTIYTFAITILHDDRDKMDDEITRLKNKMDYYTANMNRNEVTGWAVRFEYKCRDRFGNIKNEMARFLIDKDFKKVTFSDFKTFDTENELINEVMFNTREYILKTIDEKIK